MMVLFVSSSTENVILLSAQNLLIILYYQNKHMTNYVGGTFLLPISKINMTVIRCYINCRELLGLWN